jgi:hypothetical protein
MAKSEALDRQAKARREVIFDMVIPLMKLFCGVMAFESAICQQVIYTNVDKLG